MAKRTSRRAIRDRLDQAHKLVVRAEGLLAEVTARYYERGTQEGYLIELMRETLESTGKNIADFRATRS
jgi:hypothetical protein